MSAIEMRVLMEHINLSYKQNLISTTALSENAVSDIVTILKNTLKIIKVAAGTANIVVKSLWAIGVWIWHHKLTTAFGVLGVELGPNAFSTAYDITTRLAHYAVKNFSAVSQIAYAWASYFNKLYQTGDIWTMPPYKDTGNTIVAAVSGIMTPKGGWIVNSVKGMMSIIMRKFQLAGDVISFLEQLCHIAIELAIPATVVLGLVKLWQGSKSNAQQIYSLLDSNKLLMAPAMEKLDTISTPSLPIPSRDGDQQPVAVKQIGSDKTSSDK